MTDISIQYEPWKDKIVLHPGDTITVNLPLIFEDPVTKAKYTPFYVEGVFKNVSGTLIMERVFRIRQPFA